MKYTLIFLFSGLVLLTNCSGEKESLIAEIDQIEQDFDLDQSPEVANQLIEKYKLFEATFPEETERNSRYLYRAAGIYYRMNRNNAALDLLRKALKNYQGSNNTVNNAFLLATIHDEVYSDKAIATTIYQALQDYDLDDDQKATLEEKLKNVNQPIVEILTDLQKKVFNDSVGRIDYRFANEYIQSSEVFVYLSPDHPAAADVALKAAETARTVRAFPKAMNLYEIISERYQDHPKAPQALFLRAFTLDNDLKRLDEARALYEKFLELYPNDEFADDTEFLLKNLGKSDEEIIQSFSNEEQTPPPSEE